MFVLPKEVSVYVEQLNELQRKAFAIAEGHLGSSFHLARSNGFVEWTKLQILLEGYLNDIDKNVATKIWEERCASGPTFHIEETAEFKEWEKLQKEKKK